MSVSLEGVISAISTSLNSFALSHDRRDAENYLNQIKKTNSKDIFQLLLQILLSTQTQYHDSILQLVLSLVSDWIQIWWNHLQSSDHEYIRNTMLQLIFNQRIVNFKVMRNKLSVIISNIAKRQFPQQWETFITDMISIWTQYAFEQQEIVMMIFEILITDCIDPDFSASLPSLRKSDILQGLRNHLDQVLQVSNQYLSYCMNEYQSKINLLQNENEKTALRNIKNSISDVLKMLQPIITFIKSDELYKFQPEIFNVICMITNPDFQSFATLILQSMCSGKAENFETFYAIMERVCSYPINVSNVVSETFELTEVLTTHSIYSQSLVALVNYNIGHMMNPKFSSNSSDTANSSDLRTVFLSLLASVAASPSLRLAQELLPNWTSMFHDSELTSLPAFLVVAKTLLQEYMTRSIQSIWIKEGEELVSQDEIVATDFESWDDYKDNLGNFKTQFRSLVFLLSKKFPLLVSTEVSQRLSYLIAQETVNPQNYYNGNTRGYIRKDTSILLRGLESLHPPLGEFVKFVQIVSGSAPNNHHLLETHVRKDDSVYVTILTTVWSMFDHLIAWQVIDPQLMKWRIRLLLSFSPVLALDTDRIYRLISLLFNYMNFQVKLTADLMPPTSRSANSTVRPSQNYDDVGLTKEYLLEEGVVVRRRAAAAISSIVVECASIIVSSSFYRDFVVQACSMISDESNHLLSGQRSSLRECLVTLSENTKITSQRDELLSLALESIVAQWQILSSQVFASSSSLLQLADNHVNQYLYAKHSASYNVAESDIAPSVVIEASGSSFIQLKSVFNTVISIAKRVGVPNIEDSVWVNRVSYNFDEICRIFPFAIIWKAFFSGLLLALNSINQIWTPEFRLQYPDNKSLDLYAPHSSYIQSLALSSIETDAAQNDPIISDGGTLFSVLTELRRLIFQMLGLCCQQQIFYYLPEHLEIVRNISENLVNMENSQMTTLINQFVIKYITNAPPSPSSQSIVTSFLQVFLNHNHHRLLMAWQPVYHTFEDTTPIDAFRHTLYRQSSIPQSGLDGLSNEILDLARERFTTSFSRSFADSLAFLACLAGSLAEKTVVVSNASNDDVGDGLMTSTIASTVSKSKSKSNHKKKTASVPGLSLPIAGTGGSNQNSGSIIQIQERYDSIVEDNVAGINGSLSNSGDLKQSNLLIEMRRNWMMELLFAPSQSQITRLFVQSTLALLCCPDAVCIRKGTTFSDFLLRRSIKDDRLVSVVAGDIFAALVSIILEEKKAAIGLEWEIVDSVQQIYCQYVLGCDGAFAQQLVSQYGSSTAPSKGPNGVNPTSTSDHFVSGTTGSDPAIFVKSEQLMSARARGCEERGFITAQPRMLLLGIPHAATRRVFQLEVTLLESSAIKKKRRDLFRDFFGEMIDLSKQLSPRPIRGGTTTPENLLPNSDRNKASAISVFNIQERVMRPKLASTPIAAIDQSDFSLASLFG